MAVDPPVSYDRERPSTWAVFGLALGLVSVALIVPGFLGWPYAIWAFVTGFVGMVASASAWSTASRSGAGTSKRIAGAGFALSASPFALVAVALVIFVVQMVYELLRPEIVGPDREPQYPGKH